MHIHSHVATTLHIHSCAAVVPAARPTPLDFPIRFAPLRILLRRPTRCPPIYSCFGRRICLQAVLTGMSAQITHPSIRRHIFQLVHSSRHQGHAKPENRRRWRDSYDQYLSSRSVGTCIMVLIWLPGFCGSPFMAESMRCVVWQVCELFETGGLNVRLLSALGSP